VTLETDIGQGTPKLRYFVGTDGMSEFDACLPPDHLARRSPPITDRKETCQIAPRKLESAEALRMCTTLA
jgi:hypothetical protein